MAIEVDMTGVEASTGFDLLPEGWYVVRVEEAEETSSAKGTPGIKMTMKVVAGEHEGRNLWDTMWLSPKALPMARQRLEAMGVQIPDGPFAVEEKLLYGRGVRVLVRHESWEDRDGNPRVSERVKGYESAGMPSDLPDPLAGAPKAKSDGDDIPF